MTVAELLDGDRRAVADHARKLLVAQLAVRGLDGPFGGLDIACPDADLRVIVVRKVMRGLDVCAHLGATMMVVHSPYSRWDFNNLDNLDNLAAGGAYARVIDTCHKTMGGGKRAEEPGVTLGIETIQDKDPDIRPIPADRFNSQNGAVSIDPGHAH